MKKILCAAAILCLFSCKKDDELTKENVAGTYRQTGETENGVNTWNTPNYDVCEMDNTFQFKTDNSYVYTDAGAMCSPAVNYSGTWSLDGKTMTVDGSGLNVESFDGEKLVLKEVSTNTVFTLEKQ